MKLRTILAIISTFIFGVGLVLAISEDNLEYFDEVLFAGLLVLAGVFAFWEY